MGILSVRLSVCHDPVPIQGLVTCGIEWPVLAKVQDTGDRDPANNFLTIKIQKNGPKFSAFWLIALRPVVITSLNVSMHMMCRKTGIKTWVQSFGWPASQKFGRAKMCKIWRYFVQLPRRSRISQ